MWPGSEAKLNILLNRLYGTPIIANIGIVGVDRYMYVCVCVCVHAGTCASALYMYTHVHVNACYTLYMYMYIQHIGDLLWNLHVKVILLGIEITTIPF